MCIRDSSWGAGIWRWYHIPHSFTEVGRWTVLFIYLPMLAVVLLRGPSPNHPAAESMAPTSKTEGPRANSN